MLYFINDSLIKQLDEDINFRTRLAAAMCISERAIYNTIKRYLTKPFANCSLTKLSAVEYLRSIGLKDEQIFYTKQPA